MKDITLVKDAIHRPDEPRHFMQYGFPSDGYCVLIDDQELARSIQVLILSEVGYAIYDPVIYFPVTDVNFERLKKIEKSTHCPLKGDTEYYDSIKLADDQQYREIAWRYIKPFDFASKLKDYVAFDRRKVRVVQVL